MGIIVYSLLWTLRTLNYGNYGIFLNMGNAGFISSTVWSDAQLQRPSRRPRTPAHGQVFSLFPLKKEKVGNDLVNAATSCIFIYGKLLQLIINAFICKMRTNNGHLSVHVTT